jgi:hypothetical protein
MDELNIDTGPVTEPAAAAPKVDPNASALEEIRNLRGIGGAGASEIMKLYQKYMEPAPKPQIFGFSYDPTLMNITRALLQPTKSGTTGESIGFAAEAAEASRIEQEKRERELLKSKIELAQLLPGLSEKLAGTKTEELTDKLAAEVYKLNPETGKYEIDRSMAEKLSQYPELQSKVLTKVRAMKDAMTPKFEKLGAGDMLIDPDNPGKPLVTAPFKPTTAGEGMTVNVNEKTGEITVINKVDKTFTVLREADIPLDVRLQNQQEAIKRSESYPPGQKADMVARFSKELNDAYLKANAKTIAASSGQTPQKLETPAPAAGAPTPTTGVNKPSAVEPATPTVAGTPAPTKEEKKYVSPFGNYITAPPSPIATAGEETAQQRSQRESQLRISEEDAKEWNKKVNSTSSSGAADVSAARQLISALPKVGETGSLTPIKREVGAVLSSLGIQGNVTDAASAIDIAQSAINSRTLGQQLEQVGVQTKSDTDLIMKAGPALTQPKDALTFLARQSLAAGERKMEMARFREDWRRYNRSDVGASDAWYRYIGETPLVGQTPNGKMMFVNEYVKAFTNAHREMNSSEAKATALDNWRRMVRGQ